MAADEVDMEESLADKENVMPPAVTSNYFATPQSRPQSTFSLQDTTVVDMQGSEQASSSYGYPSIQTLRKTGPGTMISRLLGDKDSQGTLGNWNSPAFDYDVLPETFEPPVSTSSALVAVPYPHHITAQDLALSRPHPRAFFSPQCLGWSIATLWPPNTIEPSARYKSRQGKCPQPSNQDWPAHHFVCSLGVVDPRYILRPGSSSSSSTELGAPSDVLWESQKLVPTGTPSITTKTSKKELWSLYSCSTDTDLAFTTSPEGVVPVSMGKEVARRFQDFRTENPSLSTSHSVTAADRERAKDETLANAWDTIWKMIDNVLFRGETRALPVASNLFKRKVGWDPTSAELFQRLNFSYDGTAQVLHMPSVDQDTEEGKSNRTLLLRAWLETGLLSSFYRERLPVQSIPKSSSPASSRSSTESEAEKKLRSSRLLQCLKPFDARDTIGPMLCGNHCRSISSPCTRSLTSQPVIKAQRTSEWKSVGSKSTNPLENDYALLGCVATDPDSIIEHAYSRQIQTDPLKAPHYLTALCHIAEDSGSIELQTTIAHARSIGQYSSEEEAEAYSAILSYPPTSALSEIGDEVICEAFQQKYDLCHTKTSKQSLRQSLNFLAKIRKSDLLSGVYASTAEQEKPAMTLEKAYETLQASAAVDDFLLVTAYDINVSDNAAKKKDLTEALSVVAQARNSEALKRFLDTGEKPQMNDDQIMWGPALQPVSADRPVGLENIGNTCYLNSLLQYLYTIRQLREVILAHGQLSESDEFRAGQKRVGGRLVTQQELDRSRKFVRLLADLFNSLIYAQVQAIRPEKELAYLALVTSQDEKQQDTPEIRNNANEGATGDTPQDQMDIDHFKSKASGSLLSNSHSILGKRSIDHLDENNQPPAPPSLSDVEMNSAESDDFILVNSPNQATFEPSLQTNLKTDDKSDLVATETADGITEIGPINAKQPLLPPRRKASEAFSLGSGGEMMFGKQHDLSECMDNVMFQIEVAFDPAKVLSFFGTSSVVQSLFYGRTRQTLTFEDAPAEVRPKEEPFSYLLVDVAEEGRDVYEGLDNAFADQTVEIEGRKAKRKLTLASAPPILQIQLQRVQFDRQTSRIFKSNAFMGFPPILKMDRYLAPVAENASQNERANLTEQRRHQMRNLREASDSLNGAKNKRAPEHLKAIGTFSKVLSDSLSLPDLACLEECHTESMTLSKQQLEAKLETNAIKEEMDQIWQDSHLAEYNLAGVFMHRGEANFGHYWLHQRALPKQPERWFKFNDSQVTDIEATEIFADSTGVTANPYWLTYVHKDHQDAIDAVCRVI